MKIILLFLIFSFSKVLSQDNAQFLSDLDNTFPESIIPFNKSESAALKGSKINFVVVTSGQKENVYFLSNGHVDSVKMYLHGKKKLIGERFFLYDSNYRLLYHKKLMQNKYLSIDSFAYDSYGRLTRCFSFYFDKYSRSEQIKDTTLNLFFCGKEGVNYLLDNNKKGKERLVYYLNENNECIKLKSTDIVDSISYVFEDSLNWYKQFYRNGVLKREIYRRANLIIYDNVAAKDESLIHKYHDSNRLGYDFFYDNKDRLVCKYNRFTSHSSQLNYYYIGCLLREQIFVEANVARHIYYKYYSGTQRPDILNK